MLLIGCFLRNTWCFYLIELNWFSQFGLQRLIFEFHGELSYTFHNFQIFITLLGLWRSCLSLWLRCWRLNRRLRCSLCWSCNIYYFDLISLCLTLRRTRFLYLRRSYFGNLLLWLIVYCFRSCLVLSLSLWRYCSCLWLRFCLLFHYLSWLCNGNWLSLRLCFLPL